MTCIFVFLNIVEVKSSEKDGFVIKLISGRLLRCAHINPLAGKPPELSPHPAIVLRMEDGTGLLLPVLASMFIIIAVYLQFGILSFEV